MLKVLIGSLLAFGSYNVIAQSGSSCLEKAKSKGEELSCKVKTIPSYYPAHEQVGGLTLYGESMFSEREVDCRVASFDSKTIQQIPGWEDIVGLNETAVDPVKTLVSGAWMRFGLIVGNNNVGENGNYTVVIDHLTLMARGKHSQNVFNHVRPLRSGYCGMPFLYVVPPGNTVDYRPLSDNPMENLTLYLDGIPVMESIESNQPIKIIPEYKMEFTLMGWFVSEDGSSVEPFFKRFGLSTPSLSFVRTSESGGRSASWVRVPNR